MVPFFSYLQYKHSNFQQNDGFITGITASGGLTPMTITVVGPNGYTAGPFVTPTPVPALTGLEPGVYTITVVAADAETNSIEITIVELPETVLTADIPDACDCAACNCEITISDYVHNSDCFTYNLYLDGVIVDTYSGCTGLEPHVFTGLCNGQYSIEVIENDSLIYTFNNPYDCDPGEVIIDDSLDVATIVSTWRRFAQSNMVFDFSLGGVNNGATPVKEIGFDGGWSGLRPDGTIDYTNIEAFFYTGGNPASYTDPGGTTPLDPNATRFLGTYTGGGYQEGEHLNDSFFGVVPSAGNNKKYFYDATLGKFVYVGNVDFISDVYRWITFLAKDPIESNPGDPLKWPNATTFYTTDTNWNAIPIGAQDYTIDPNDGNTVKLASAITNPVTEKINAANNALLRNGFYSDCKYITYTHEVTIGSTDDDDDFISIILARAVDDDGISHFLSLDFRARGEVGFFTPAVSIQYNGTGFENRDQSIYTFNNGETDIDLFEASPYIIKNTGANSPLNNTPANFDVQGNIRVRVTRSGDQGQFFKIEMTDTMGDKSGIQTLATKDLTEVNGFNAAYTIEFALDDPGTWLAAPGYANGDELLKFLGPNEFGYSTVSQAETNFYHLSFIGEQSNTTNDVIDLPGAIDQIDLPGCPCYLATNCEDPSDQIQVTLENGSLDVNLTYIFNEYPGKCWTIEELDDCTTQTISINTGLVAPNTLGNYNDPDAYWNVVGLAPSGTATTPFPARVSNQLWDGSYGSIPGAAWITRGGIPNGSGNLPHDLTPGVNVYELNFNLPIGVVPPLAVQLLTDQTAKVYFNGNLVFDNSTATTAWITPSTFNIVSGFIVGTNTIVVELTGGVLLDTNGFAMAGSISQGNPPSEVITISETFDNCELCVNPIIPNICYDLEVVCGGSCPDLYGVNSFDFFPYIGQNISIQPPISTDPECWYTPRAIRQAVFVNLGTDSLSFPNGGFQQGTNDITFAITSFIYNGQEQISGTPPSVLMTPATYNPVECNLLSCVPVAPNTTENSFTNVPDFINTVIATAGINTMQAYANDPRNCPICTLPVVTDSGRASQSEPKDECEETFRIQYRDGDTYSMVISVTNNSGTRLITIAVGPSNTTTQVLTIVGEPRFITYFPCNDNIYCALPDVEYPITGVTVEGPCPPPALGEACEIVPRLGEPGFSTKNCDPKKVIDVKTKFADSVYAWFKRARYGIDTCCEYDLDQIDIKNQLIDLGSIYDPDMCIDGDPVVDCCPQPCNAVVTLEIPEAITCPAPEAPVSAIVVPGPPTPAPCGAPTNMDGNPKAVRGRVYITGDSCLTVELLAINNGSPSTYMATACDSSPINENLVVGQPAVVLCVDPTQPITNNNVQATYTGLCV